MKSQLDGKTINAPKPTAPESAFGQFVFGDIKGGSAAHEYRMSVVAGAIREALKGNSRAYLEATAIATGKSKKAASYFVGFAAVGLPARITYAGRLSDPENKGVVAQIEAETVRLSHEFELAFLTRFHAPAEGKGEKASRLTQQDYVETAEAYSALEKEHTALKAQLAAPVELGVGDTIAAAASAISAGLALPAEAELVRQALAAYDAARLLAAMEAAANTAEPVAA